MRLWRELGRERRCERPACVCLAPVQRRKPDNCLGAPRGGAVLTASTLLAAPCCSAMASARRHRRGRQSESNHCEHRSWPRIYATPHCVVANASRNRPSSCSGRLSTPAARLRPLPPKRSHRALAPETLASGARTLTKKSPAARCLKTACASSGSAAARVLANVPVTRRLHGASTSNRTRPCMHSEKTADSWACARSARRMPSMRLTMASCSL